MKNRLLFLPISLGLAIFAVSACKQPGAAPATQEAMPAMAAPEATRINPALPKGKHTITATFKEFIFGDAEHYLFEETAVAGKEAKEWDFGGCEEQVLDFGIELPEKEANSDNQGWASNKKLQGKKFQLTFEYRRQPLYIEGPMGDVPVITSAKQL